MDCGIHDTSTTQRQKDLFLNPSSFVAYETIIRNDDSLLVFFDYFIHIYNMLNSLIYLSLLRTEQKMRKIERQLISLFIATPGPRILFLIASPTAEKRRSCYSSLLSVWMQQKKFGQAGRRHRIENSLSQNEQQSPTLKEGKSKNNGQN